MGALLIALFVGKMVRDYKRKTTSIDKLQLEKAKKAVSNGKSIKGAAREFGLSYTTLQYHCDASIRVGTRPKVVDDDIFHYDYYAD